MTLLRHFLPIMLCLAALQASAQEDTASATSLHQLRLKSIQEIDKKVDQYTKRITNKTEQTLTKLARWEGKIKSILEKTSPETAQKLFGNDRLTFAAALEQYKKGEKILTDHKATYDAYRDRLTTSIRYLQDSSVTHNLNGKLSAAAHAAGKKLDVLNSATDEQEAIAQFIKARKKELIDQSLRYLGHSKYLNKIDKKAYYYVETIRNYKELLNNPKKAEATVLALLHKIPAFNRFTQENSMLAQLFGGPTAAAGAGTAASLAGLQTRGSVNALIQNQLAIAGPAAAEQIRQHIQDAQAQLSALKDKVLQAGGNSSDTELPSFKPNTQKPKTFLQRMEWGSNIQFSKNNTLLPTTADIALTAGYKPNDKSVIGAGLSYKMGLGSINRLSISHQGIGLRSFIDWKAPFGNRKSIITSGWYFSGGYEMNYQAAFTHFSQLQQYNQWQASGLLGLSKKISIKSKLTKGTQLSLLYDMLANQHTPVSQPVVFRVGYKF